MSKIATALHNVTRLPFKQTAAVIFHIAEKDEHVFTTPNGETYVLRRQDEGTRYVLDTQEGKPGNPSVVQMFNKYMSMSQERRSRFEY